MKYPPVVLVCTLLFIACSKDKPAPLGPTGKAIAITDAPMAPINLRIKALTDTSATLAWDAVEGATDYDLNYRTLDGRWTNWLIRDTTTTTVHPLAPDTKYRWAVRAENRDGASRWVFSTFTTLSSSQPSIPLSEFDIELFFAPDVPERDRLLFRRAADRWQEVILGDVRNVKLSSGTSYVYLGNKQVIDDLAVIVQTDSRMTPLGDALVYKWRSGGIPYVARVRYQQGLWERLEREFRAYGTPESVHHLSDDWADLRIEQLALHELGHALGLVPTHPQQGRAFTGPLAVEAFTALAGIPYAGRGVPLTPDKSHWHSLILPEEIMSHSGNPEIQVISAVSIAALADLGYEVDHTQAQPVRRYEAGYPHFWHKDYAEERNPFAVAIYEAFTGEKFHERELIEFD